MNFNVTEFYVIYTYHQLSQTVHDRRPEQPCLPDLANTPCGICAVEFGDEELDEIEKRNQRLAVTPCYHIFHENCMKQYITKIFRFYVARAYAAFSPMWENGAPLPRAHLIECLVPHFANSREGVQAIGGDIYNPFGHAQNDPPGPMLNYRRTNQQLTCPQCRHYLDQEMAPNTESSHCFMGYFQRHDIEYPQLVPRYTFMNDAHLNGHGPMYKVVREVAHFDSQIRDRTDTHFYYDMPGHENVNNYFQLPQIQAYYAIHQHDGDRALLYEQPEPRAPAHPPAHAHVHPAHVHPAPAHAPAHAPHPPAHAPAHAPAAADVPVRRLLDVTEFYRLFTYNTLRAAMNEARHCFDIEGVEEDDQDKCSICQNLLNDPDYDSNSIAVARCFDVFHKECIDNYINGKFRNFIAINAINTQGDNPLPRQPIGRAGQGTELFDCPNCHRLLDQPDIESQKGTCFKNYLRRRNIPYLDLLDREVIRGGDIFTNYSLAPNVADPTILPHFNILPPFPPVIGVLNVLRNAYRVHVDENDMLRNDENEHVDYYGNPANPPTIYLRQDDPNFNGRVRRYYDVYPDRNKYMDIFELDNILNQPVRRSFQRELEVFAIPEVPVPMADLPLPDVPAFPRAEEAVPFPLPPVPAPMRRALDGKECGPRHGPPHTRWTRPELEDLARRAGLSREQIRNSDIPALCHALHDFRIPAEPRRVAVAAPAMAPVVAPLVAVRAVAAPVVAPMVAPPVAAPRAALPICRDGRPRGRNPQMDLTVDSAKNLASQHGLSNRGSKPELCNRLIGHVPPLARRPYADEGRRTKRKHRTRKNKLRSKH